MTNDMVKRFISNDSVRKTLFEEVPPVITVVVRYLKHINEDVFTIETSRLHLASGSYKSDDNKTMCGYCKNISDTENKITKFLGQFDKIEGVWLEKPGCFETKIIGKIEKE